VKGMLGEKARKQFISKNSPLDTLVRAAAEHVESRALISRPSAGCGGEIANNSGFRRHESIYSFHVRKHQGSS